MSKFKRTDKNQADILKSLRANKISYFDTSGVGRGFPDLCVGYEGVNYFFEIKNPEYSTRLTQPETKFMQTWNGSYYVVTSADEIYNLIGYDCLEDKI